MREFVKGQKSKLVDLTPATDLTVGIGLNIAQNQPLTLCCLGVDTAGKLAESRFIIFNDQKTSPEGAIKSKGPQNGDKEQFEISLKSIPPTITRLVFCAILAGPGKLALVSGGYLRLIVGQQEIACYRFEGQDFTNETAIIIAEIYLKDVWRFGAVGQGFSGGLTALFKHFGSTETALPKPPPVPKAVSTSSTTPRSPLSASRLSLEKKLAQQAPQILSLVKQASVSLKKVGLDEHRARVALCLDISGSMASLYSSSKIQRFSERILALGCRFDDDGAIDIFLFGEHAYSAGELSVDNFGGFVDRILKKYQLEGGTYYGRVLKAIRSFYFPQNAGGKTQKPLTAPIPTYVMFVTDGATFDEDETRNQIRWSSFEPIFWQFMAIGKSRKDVKDGGLGSFFKQLTASDFRFLEELDTMEDRYVDNANFFSVEDPISIADNELYDLLMQEYPDWVKLAKPKGLLS